MFACFPGDHALVELAAWNKWNERGKGFSHYGGEKNGQDERNGNLHLLPP